MALRGCKHEPSCSSPFCLKRVIFSNPFGRDAEHVQKREESRRYHHLRLRLSSGSGQIGPCEEKCLRRRDRDFVPVERSPITVRYPVLLPRLLDLFPYGFHQHNEVWIPFTVIFAAAISSLATQAQNRKCTRSCRLVCGWGYYGHDLGGQGSVYNCLMSGMRSRLVIDRELRPSDAAL